LLGRLIEQNDLLLLIDRQDGVHSGLHDAFEPQGTTSQPFLDMLTLGDGHGLAFLRLFPLRYGHGHSFAQLSSVH
jgi:hypothetical protein